jgi:hypothetical protein
LCNGIERPEILAFSGSFPGAVILDLTDKVGLEVRVV